MKRKIVKEGKATIYIIPGEIKKSDTVFYNPKMRINRDISVLALKAFLKETNRNVCILDVMASTGIRGIRYIKECENIHKVVFNDLNPYAISLLKENIKFNKINDKEIETKIESRDAASLMHDYRFKGDVVDLDPFGSPIQYLDALARCTSNKGLAMITFTDTAVLAGTYPRTALRRYAVKHSKKYTPKGEISLRVALKTIAESFSKFDKGIIPLVSISHKHYVRIIIKIDKHKKAAERNIELLQYLHFNEKNEKFYSGCENERNYFSIGKVWSGPLGNSIFIEKMLNLLEKDLSLYDKETLKILKIIKKEYAIKGHYYDLPTLGKGYKKPLPPFDYLKEKLESQGYHIAKSHIKGNAIVTDAPYKNLVEIIT